MILHTAQGYAYQIDAEDADKVIGIKWHTDNGYLTHTVTKRTEAIFNQPAGSAVKMHRWIMDAPKDMQVDHINHDRSDNRRSNLRLCTQSENNCNKPSWAGQSRYKGVSLRKDSPHKPWRAIVYYGGRKHCLGSYKTEEEAALAYNEAARQYQGEYAVLNDVPEALAPVA